MLPVRESCRRFRGDDDQSNPQPAGILKISDFGLADFHTAHSRSNIRASTLGFTNTYKAPEIDVRDHVSQAYDIWSMGCVLLEFVTWYLLGWEGVDNFSMRRMGDSNNFIPEDNFFNFYPMSDGTHKRTAKAKPSVVKVSRAVVLLFMPLIHVS